jgi:hypothetical protein
MRNLSVICLFACLGIVSLSCQKEKLPKPSQSGANTFGCKINGKNWVPHSTGGFGGTEPTIGGFFYSANNRPDVWITAYDDRTSIDLFLNNVTSTGEYLLNQTTQPIPPSTRPANYGAYFIDGNTIADPDYAYITSRQYTGKVTITRAGTVNRIVSGTFEFTAYDSDSKQTVRITDGRFDIQNH